MKFIFKIIILLYCTTVFRNVIVYASFEINKEQIISELCVEKNFKVNECQGQCHLNKVLNEVNDNEEEENPKNKRIKNIELEENIIPNQFSITFPPLLQKHHSLPPFITNELKVDLEIASPPPKV